MADEMITIWNVQVVKPAKETINISRVNIKQMHSLCSFTVQINIKPNVLSVVSHKDPVLDLYFLLSNSFKT